MKTFVLFAVLFVSPAFAATNLEILRYKNGLKLSAGIVEEKAPFKACIIYLEGLGDSIRNHEPYFNALTEAGYRILLFDYMGQGGSSGYMDNTRIVPERPVKGNPQVFKHYETVERPYEIPEQAEFIWNHNAAKCANSKRFVIGWSTGGLAAYQMAFAKQADAVVLIAPGIHPKVLVGELSRDLTQVFGSVISERTLTRNRFVGQLNPHLDPPVPSSPVQVPVFASKLLFLAAPAAQDYKIPKSVKGLVFLSGVEDSYVDRDATISTLKSNASHFTWVSYDGALHELDNELPEVTSDLYQRTIRFFDSSLQLGSAGSSRKQMRTGF